MNKWVNNDLSTFYPTKIHPFAISRGNMASPSRFKVLVANSMLFDKKEKKGYSLTNNKMGGDKQEMTTFYLQSPTH